MRCYALRPFVSGIRDNRRPTTEDNVCDGYADHQIRPTNARHVHEAATDNYPGIRNYVVPGEDPTRSHMDAAISMPCDQFEAHEIGS